MKITAKLIEWAQDKGACKEGIEQAEKMIGRDVHDLKPNYRAWVMVRRPDCPINLEGLTSDYRAWVMAKRPDCPLDLDGLTNDERAWVISERPKYKPETTTT